jgi:hypothetical protein
VAIVLGHVTPQEQAALLEAGYDPASREAVDDLFHATPEGGDVAAAFWVDCDLTQLLTPIRPPAKQAGLDVVILCTEFLEDEMALIVNGRHVLTSDEGNRLEDPEGFVAAVADVLGIPHVRCKFVVVDPGELGFTGFLPREWDGLAQLWLRSEGSSF